jgi:hypothetical protein
MFEDKILEIYICDDDLNLRPGKKEVLIYDCASRRYISFQDIDKVNIFRGLDKPDDSGWLRRVEE